MNTLPILVLVGAITVYGGPAHIGQPLYCDRGQGLIYDPAAPPWVALDAGLYRDGRVRCGDEIWIVTANAPCEREPHCSMRSAQDGATNDERAPLRARALDAGYLDGYFVLGAPGTANALLRRPSPAALPIVADLPAHLAPFPGLSAPGRVINHSAACRAFTEAAGQ